MVVSFADRWRSSRTRLSADRASWKHHFMMLGHFNGNLWRSELGDTATQSISYPRQFGKLTTCSSLLNRISLVVRVATHFAVYSRMQTITEPYWELKHAIIRSKDEDITCR